MSSADVVKSQTVEIVKKIVDKFEDYFKQHSSDVYGRPAKWVDVRNVHWEKKIGLTGIHLIKVRYETDVGMDSASLAVKIYESVEDCQRFVAKINQLQELMKRFPLNDVHTPGILYAKENYLIMEGINQGIEFRDLVIPRNEAYRLAGRALATVHGELSWEVNLDRYGALVQEALSHIPETGATQTLKIELQELFSQAEHQLATSLKEAGAPHFGDFHPGNVLFDLQVVSNKKSVVACNLIDPEFLDEEARSDRFEDLTNFFITDAVSHGWHEISHLENKLIHFMSGYDQVLALKFSSLKEHYPHGFTVAFQLGLGILLSILNLLQFEDLQEGKDLPSEIDYRLNLVKYLWQIYALTEYRYWPLKRLRVTQ